jgi:Glycosyl hydrolase family 115/Gylcosyl hydrolase family 115 C-terminal domain
MIHALLAVCAALICAVSVQAADVAVIAAPAPGAVALITPKGVAAVIVDPADDVGVLRAAANLRTDMAAVSGNKGLAEQAGLPVIVGTIGQSTAIDALIAAGKLDVTGITGVWEAFVQQVVEAPSPGTTRALVIAGADRRGTIFGIYDLSARIGVSPWHWWADVPVPIRDHVYVSAGRRIDAPKVRYRGIFINDEEPALGDWARGQFGGINAKFYDRVFDLLLRLKGNYLWPAMWGKSLWQDDPKAAQLAHESGVILGTSHHEPMMRAHVEWQRAGPGKWDYRSNAAALQAFWKDGVTRSNGTDRIVTIGMRGDGDEPMEQGTAITLLETIVADQRNIITQVTGTPAENTPQIWALYKEVQDYYDQGMRVPDDVTLLFADDNWGNIRRLPPAGTKRKGGAGVYYHFDYVGDPRNYKWINTNQIERVWEQMGSARANGADTMWIVNVGDIKPMELPTSFFLDLAWNPDGWPLDSLPTYYKTWAAQQFGAAQSVEIAAILAKTTRLNARRKPELIDAAYYRTNDDGEAERIAADYVDLDRRARAIGAVLRRDQQSAFYQLLLHPIEAMANLHRLYRATAEGDAKDAGAAFAQDQAIGKGYEALENGKWRGMMSQTHISYTGWQQPERDVQPSPVDWRIDTRKPSGPGATAIKRQKRFLEKDGRIVIEAPGFMRASNDDGAEWKVIDNLGHWQGAIALFPQIGATFSPGTGPSVDYDIALGASGDFTVALYASPSLDVVNSGGLRYSIQIDDHEPVVVDLLAGKSNEWAQAVADNIRIGISRHSVGKAGAHRVRISAIDRGTVIQRIIVSRGDLPRSKLGPAATEAR